jgi:ribosomal-protein-alanine N-acetyltransferase
MWYDYEAIISSNNILTIIPMTMCYKEIIFKEFSSNITRFMIPKEAEKIEEIESFIECAMSEKENGIGLHNVILLKETEEFLGCVGIHDINTTTPELGIWIKESKHGYGYGKLAIVTLMNWINSSNFQYEYILYPVEKNNYPSRRIPEALGGTIFREYQIFNSKGGELNFLEYRIYRNES